MRRYGILALIAIGLLVAPVTGQAPAPLPSPSVLLELDAPPPLRVGDLLEIDASRSAATTLAWTCVVQTGEPLQFRLANGDRTLFAGTPRPGRYTIVVAGCLGDQLELRTVVVQVEGPSPVDPPVPPSPPSPPGPVLPADRYGLTKVAYDLAAPLAAQYGPLLRELAGNYESVASRGVAVRSMTGPEMRTEVTARNRASAGSNRDSLIPPLFAPLGSACGDVERSGKLATTSDWAVLFREIAAGLRLAAGGTSQ